MACCLTVTEANWNMAKLHVFVHILFSPKILHKYYTKQNGLCTQFHRIHWLKHKNLYDFSLREILGGLSILLWSPEYRSAATHFTKSIRSHHWNLMNFFTWIFIVMIRSCHYFAKATTAQLPWLVQNSDLIAPLFFMLEQHLFSRDLDHGLINC